MKYYLGLLSAAFIFVACSSTQKQKADLLVFNATIYTVDSAFSTAEAMVVNDGRILELGTHVALQAKYDAKDELDAKGKFIYPGFIDAHAHFVGYGLGLQTANLVGTQSWEDILHRLDEFSKDLPKDQWLIGRGWDQNDWKVKDFPTNELLTAQFPDRPVLLTRIDGHAAIVNDRALEMAGIVPGVQMTGGEVEVKNGKLTGILIDNAVDIVSSKVPSITKERFKDALRAAEKNCFAVGLTTIDDCGLGFDAVTQIRALQDNGDLKMRMYVMLSDDQRNFDSLLKTGKIKTDRLNVRSFKVYGDGALGSRGACLLHPYDDKAGHYGFLLSQPAHFVHTCDW